MKVLATILLVYLLAAYFHVLVAASSDPTVTAGSVDPAEKLKAPKQALKTDEETLQKEEERINPDGYSVAELKLMREKSEHHHFQTEVSRLMSIIINSLYSNKDIFLREAISNASDALDKLRFLSLTNKALLGEGDLAQLDIRIKIDKENNQMHLIDKGVGMTREELVKNLGTIAKSGTKEFVEKLQEGSDSSNLIGQFGVGFYSYFLVADKVTVTSKSNDDPKQWIWESEAGDSFTIVEDPKGNTLGRGTRITLHLKKDAAYLLDENTIKNLIQKYSEFIAFPIYLWTTRTESKEVPVEDEPAKEAEEKKDDSDKVEVEDEEEEDAAKEDKPKTKTVTETISEWKLVNENKPLWTRKPADITDEEYKNFYKAISKDSLGEALKHIHFNAEGDVEFKSILYIPATAPQNMFQFRSDAHKGLKLYVRRVFISDDFDNLLPSYLSFLRGVVDSDDLPLNVSRETLQQDKLLDKIRKKVVRKAIAMIQELAKNEGDKYKTFWKEYAQAVKYGVVEDSENRSRLEKLLRFKSNTQSEETSFEDYVKRMKKGQEEIYFLAGESKEVMEKSPLLERLSKRGFEVLLMDDPLDEYMTQHLTRFDGKHKLVNIAQEGLKIPGLDETEDDKKKIDEEFKDLLTWVKDNLKDKIEKAMVSQRLTSSPSALVTTSYGPTANMDRIYKAQALGKSYGMKPRRVMELNPRHPIVVELNRRVKEDKEDPTAKNIVELLYDTAALHSGFQLEDPADFAARINRMLKSSLNLDPDVEPELPEEPLAEPKEEPKPKEDAPKEAATKDEL